MYWIDFRRQVFIFILKTYYLGLRLKDRGLRKARLALGEKKEKTCLHLLK
jgi:hypothetical protein